jgi:hypothetical protein
VSKHSSTIPVRYDKSLRHGRAERLEGSYLRTFAVELKEQLAQTLTAFVMSILTQPRRRLDAESAAEPPLCQIINLLQQVMCTCDAEKLAISVLEIGWRSRETGEKLIGLAARLWS